MAGEVDLLDAIVFGVIRGILSWAVWVGAALLIGATILKTPETRADWGEIARGTGFSQTPGLLNILVFVSILGEVVRVSLSSGNWPPCFLRSGKAWTTTPSGVPSLSC